jgi:hypothetical protein
VDAKSLDPYGAALWAYFDGEPDAELIVRRDDGQEGRLPVSHFYRGPAVLEKNAIERCESPVLDVGAGTGLQLIRPPLLAAVALLALALPGTTRAQPYYTYVEGGYIGVNPKSGDELLDSGKGWFIGTSWRLQQFHTFLEYRDASIDTTLGEAVDQTQWLFGGGWHGLLGNPADLVVELGYINSDFNLSFTSGGDSGYFVNGGVRWKVIRPFELDASASYVDLGGDRTSEVIYRLDAIAFIRSFGIGGGYRKADRTDSYDLFLRFNLGN